MQIVKRRVEPSTGKLFKADDDSYEKSFLRAIKPVISIAQIFGLFPISGIDSKDPKCIKFTWRSLRPWFSLCFVFTSFGVAFLLLYQQSHKGPLTTSNIVGMIFYGNCALICTSICQFSSKFGDIMVRWSEIERKLSTVKEENISNEWTLKTKVHVCAAVGLIGAFFEHLMSLSGQAQRNVYENRVCNRSEVDFLQDFITKHLDFAYSVIEYNHFVGILSEYFNFSFTFYWNFLDVFIMVISIGISSLYGRINHRLKFFRNRVIHDSVWSEVRVHYNEISELLKIIDEAMNKMIVLASYNDAYFIMIQLLNISTHHAFIVDRIYFYYSVTYLMYRASATFLFASTIFQASRKPLQIIRSVPDKGWSQEVERFAFQINTEVYALSGMKFFYLTKKALFALAGTIFTYLLVLLQYNTTEQERDAWVGCD